MSQQVLVPGDHVEFTYNGKLRNLNVDKVERKHGKTLVSGYDRSAGENAYRCFNQANMKNLRPLTIQTQKSQPTSNICSKVSSMPVDPSTQPIQTVVVISYYDPRQADVLNMLTRLLGGL